MEYRVNYDRVEEVAKAFRKLGIGGVKIFEEHDTQFHVAKQISERCPQIAQPLLYLNSLVSYRLMYRGEEFWMLFAQYVSKECSHVNSFRDVVNLVASFTLRYNKIMIKQKINRLEKIKKCDDLIDYINVHKFEMLVRHTAKCLHSEPESKTIVFGVKMLYYGLKAKGCDVVLPSSIPIPVDRRVALVTYLSGLVDIAGGTSVALTRLLGIPNVIRKIWQKVSELSSIPPLHIDSVLWYLGKYGYRLVTRSSILSIIDHQLLSRIGEEVVKYLIYELFYRLPP